ncbi:hypothetical protein BKA70DRAFT_1279258 [Coprinopsis sp. MPI-PUGE-AT-0042]|nr:hypothetical protein BKA70DRAFT_1279258 [Coprinopsis sp. MPI-PUGE-AT-0042]
MNSRQPISSLTYIQRPASPSPATFTIPPADPRLFPYTTVNDPIPDTLLPVLDEHLGKFSKSLVSINQELADLEARVIRLKSQHETLLFEKAKWASLKGVRSLPMEIVSHIISCTLQITCLEDPRGQDVDPSDMTNLRLVCRQWDEAAVSNPLLWRSLKLDVDRIESFYKKMKVHEEVPTAEVTESLSEWYDRAGSIDTGGPLRLSIVGSREVPVEDSTVEIAGILAAFLAPCTVIEGSQPSWGRWRFDCVQLRDLIIHRGSGLRALLSEFEVPFKQVFVSMGWEPSASIVRALDELKQLTLFDWQGYALFLPEHVGSMALESLFAATHTIPNTAGQLGVTFNAHLPDRLRFLHMHGPHVYLLEAIFRLPQLEEVIISGSGTCEFVRGESGPPIVNCSVQRLVLEGWAAVNGFVTLLQATTLPNMTLLRLGCPAPHPTLSWAGDHFREFLGRSSPPRLRLSMENGCRWTKAELDWILHQFNGSKLETLCLDRVDSLLQGETTTGQLVQVVKSIVCKKSPTSSTWRMVGAEGPERNGPKIPFYLPQTEKGKANLEMAGRIFDVQFLQQAAFDNLMDHGIQGHEYGKKYISPAYLG